MINVAGQPRSPHWAARFRGTDSELRTLREALERHRRFRLEQLKDLTASTSPTDITGTGDDPQSAVNLALRAAATAVLADIDDALSRIQGDHYGLCQECGAALSLRRLRAWPMIRWCGPCQHTKEATESATFESRRRGCTPTALDIVDEWGHGSFPASDPPANW